MTRQLVVVLVGSVVLAAIVGVLIGFEHLAELADRWAGRRQERRAARRSESGGSG